MCTHVYCCRKRVAKVSRNTKRNDPKRGGGGRCSWRGKLREFKRSMVIVTEWAQVFVQGFPKPFPLTYTRHTFSLSFRFVLVSSAPFPSSPVFFGGRATGRVIYGHRRCSRMHSHSAPFLGFVWRFLIFFLDNIYIYIYIWKVKTSSFI